MAGRPFPASPGRLSRRELLGGLGLGGAPGLALGGAVDRLAVLGPLRRRRRARRADADSAANRTYPFYGEHQAGIVTPAQDRLAFASMNVLDGTDPQRPPRCCWRTGRWRPSG